MCAGIYLLTGLSGLTLPGGRFEHAIEKNENHFMGLLRLRLLGAVIFDFMDGSFLLPLLQRNPV